MKHYRRRWVWLIVAAACGGKAAIDAERYLEERAHAQPQASAVSIAGAESEAPSA